MNVGIQMASATHPGLRRSHNEDALVARPEAGFAVLADGMGGHNAGEVASRMAVDIVSGGIENWLDQRRQALTRGTAEALVCDQIRQANALIYDSARRDRAYAGMGTTIVVAVWYDSNVTIGHVGDSRMYRLRLGSLKQLTRDHSLVQDHVDSGQITLEQARRSAVRNVLTRAVGTEADITSDVQTEQVERDDLYLICSDGLTDMLSDAEISKSLLACAAKLQGAADELVRQANARGGMDNVSLVLIKLLPAPVQCG